MGLMTREIRLYKEMMEKGVQVQFITYGGEEDLLLAEDLYPIELLPVYTVIKKPQYKIFQILQSLLIPYYLRSYLKKSDIFKTNQMSGSWVAVIAKVLLKKKLIVRCGYEAYKNALIASEKKHKKFSLYCISIFAYRCADAVLLNTPQIKDFVRDTFKAKNIAVYPNWIDTDLFRPIGNENRNNYEQDIFNKILYVGRFSEEKNIPLILRAMSDQKTQLTLIGGGDLSEVLKTQARELNVHSVFIPPISNDKLPSFYQSHGIYVICSLYEGNPKTLLEAMSCGCCVIGTNVPGISEALIDGETGLLIDSDMCSLRNAINRIRADKKLSLRLGLNARRYVVNNNSLNIIANKEHLLYQSVLKYKKVN